MLLQMLKARPRWGINLSGDRLRRVMLEKNRIEATKAARKEARKWKSPDKLRDRVIQEIKLLKIRVMDAMGWDGLFIPDMLITDGIAKDIASNSRRITCTPIPMQEIISWGSYEPLVLENAEETIESFLERVWQEMKDEVEQMRRQSRRRRQGNQGLLTKQRGMRVPVQQSIRCFSSTRTRLTS